MARIAETWWPTVFSEISPQDRQPVGSTGNPSGDPVVVTGPDRARLADEAAALGGWPTVHTPAVLALDEQFGALLLEGIEPGTPLVVWNWRAKETAPARVPRRSWGSLDRRQPTSGS